MKSLEMFPRKIMYWKKEENIESYDKVYSEVYTLHRLRIVKESVPDIKGRNERIKNVNHKEQTTDNRLGLGSS